MSRLARALNTVGSPGSWLHLVRVFNFIGYDAAERRKMTIGADVSISPTVSVRNGSRITLGNGCHIGQGSHLWAGNESGNIFIGDHALLAPQVFVTASDYDFDAGPGPVMDLPKREADVTIGANTWIGAHVVVVAGVVVGEGAIVAAGSVVTRDVEPHTVVGGVPARTIRHRGAPPEREQAAR